MIVYNLIHRLFSKVSIIAVITCTVKAPLHAQCCAAPANLEISSVKPTKVCAGWQIGSNSGCMVPVGAVVQYKTLEDSGWHSFRLGYNNGAQVFKGCYSLPLVSCRTYQWRVRNFAAASNDTIYSPWTYGPEHPAVCDDFADSSGQTTNVILQGFYLGPRWTGTGWNTTNTWGVPCPGDSRSYPSTNTWFYDQLVMQAKEMTASGFTAVWLPAMNKGTMGNYGPSKNPNLLIGGLYDVGYGIFDDYDLGDKMQSGSLRTRYGSRSQLTRCIAVLRANGLDTYEDFVTNQRNGANIKPQAPDYQWFRYKDAFGNFSGGRFPKYTTDFHNPPAGSPGAPGGSQDPNVPVTTFPDGSSSGWTEGYFGPDFGHITGQQNVNGTTGVWCTNQLNAWGDWLIKATGVQGYRLDNVSGISWDFLKEFVNYGAMKDKFSVAELAGSKFNASDMTKWMQDLMGQKGSNFTMYDQLLEATLVSMCKTNKFWMGALLSKHLSWGATNKINPSAGTENPGALDIYRSLMVTNPAQSVTVVNEVDMETPINGGVPSAAVPEKCLLGYAYIMTIGYGTPCVSYKDWSTQAGGYGANMIDTRNLNYHLNKLIWCHRFVCTGGLSYEQMSNNGTVYAFQRGQRAMVFMNSDQEKTQKINAATSIPNGTILVDYTDHSITDTVANGRINITVPANINGRGYLVMAPAGIAGQFSRPAETVTQEWDAAADLSILPATDTFQVVCNIWVDNNKPIAASLIDYNTTGWSGNTSLVLEIVKLEGTVSTVIASKTYSAADKGKLLSYTTNATATSGSFAFRVKGVNLPVGNTSWFNLQNTYTAPKTITAFGKND